MITRNSIRTLTVASLMATALPLAAHATQTTPATQAAEASADYLPPAYVAYSLIDKGYDLRGLQPAHGLYVANIRTADGNVQWIGVDPRTGELQSDPSRGDRRHTDNFMPTVAATDALGIVAMNDHYDLVAMRLKDAVWTVNARDQAGILAEFKVDATTGQVLSARHQGQ